ncbi:MAG: hypothetical protein D6683_18210 [Actinomyces sp.]|nr:MAG: hypothetical protein D6683_18210 [Actinomyces sp.]
MFAIGTYAVEGDIPGFGVPVHFRTETTHIPWLLLLLPVLVLLQVGLLAARNRLRRRLGVESAVEPEPAPALVPPAPALPAVIDLRDEPLDVPGPAPVGGRAATPDDTDETPVHTPEPAPASPTEPPPPDIGVTEAIQAELSAALATVARARADEELSADAALQLVVELTLEATSRARERFDLDIEAAADLAEILARSLLDEIGLDRLQRPGQLLAP